MCSMMKMNRPFAVILTAIAAALFSGMAANVASAFVPSAPATVPVATPKIQLTGLSVSGGSFVRPSAFDGKRTIYWVTPNTASGGAITVSASAPAGATLSYTLDGVAQPGSVFNLSLNPSKLMSEIGITVTNGSQTNQYYLDVCAQDPTSYTVTQQYYPGMKPYDPTTAKTLVLPDQFPGNSTTTDPAVLNFIAQYLEGSQKNTSEVTGPVLAQNPLWHSLHYHLSIWNNPSAAIIWNDAWTMVEWDQLAALYLTDPGIFMYAVDSRDNQLSPLLDTAYGSYLMNITNENYYQWLLNNIIDQCRTDNYDSVFLDSYNMDTVYSFTEGNYVHYDGTDLASYPDPQLGGMTWAQASEEFMARLTRDLNRAGIWSLPNIGNQRTTWDPVDYAYSNGGMFEGALQTPTDAHGDWQQDMSRYIYLANKGKVLIFQPGSVDINDADARLYETAAYQMCRGDYTYINEMGNGQSQASWYPEYGIGAMLGAATQTASTPDAFSPAAVDPAIGQYAIGNSLYERAFQNGLVVINADASGASHDFTVPGGGPYASVTIQPGSGGTVPAAGGIAAITGAPNYPLIQTPVSAGQVITLAGNGALILVTGNAAAYSVSLSQPGTYAFPALTCGYAATGLAPQTITVTNTGSSPTGALTVALSGANPAAFTLSQDHISSSSLAPGGSNTFDIAPGTGLNAGTYTAIVSVTGSAGIDASFPVTFTVNKAAPTIAAHNDAAALGASATLTATLAGAYLASGDSITFTATSGAISVPVTVTANGSIHFALSPADLDALGAGTHTFTISQTGAAGNAAMNNNAVANVSFALTISASGLGIGAASIPALNETALALLALLLALMGATGLHGGRRPALAVFKTLRVPGFKT